MTDALLFFAAVIVILTVGCWIGDGIGKLVEAHEIAKVPAATAQVAREAAPLSPCPKVERPVVAPQDHASHVDAQITGHVLTDTEQVRHGLKAHCSCGATYQPLASLADCGAWIRTHAETEQWIESMAPRGAS